MKIRHAIPVLLLFAGLNGCASVQTAPSPVASNPAVESTVREVKDLAEVKPLLDAGPSRTLVVFDIDDTALTAAQFFGSDYWYEWQKPEHLGTSKAVKCKFDIIAMNFEAQTMVKTQDDAAAIFNSIKQDKLFLTSRGSNYRGATIRELRKHGFELPAMLDGNSDGHIWTYAPANARKSDISYHDGVYMTTGQDKGVMLMLLLGKTGKQYDRVILLDDGKSNITNMQRAMEAARINYVGLHYTRVPKPFPVKKELAAQADAAYDETLQYVKKNFPDRYAELESGKCGY